MYSFVSVESTRILFEHAKRPTNVRRRIHDAIEKSMKQCRCSVEVEMDVNLEPYRAELRRHGYQVECLDFWPVEHKGPDALTKIRITW